LKNQKVNEQIYYKILILIEDEIAPNLSDIEFIDDEIIYETIHEPDYQMQRNLVIEQELATAKGKLFVCLFILNIFF